MILTCALSAASDLRGVGRLPVLGLGSTEPDFTPVQADCQTLGVLLEQAQAVEDGAAAILAWVWPVLLAARARRARLERRIFAGGVR